MLSYIWPIGLVVLSNAVYHICAKSVPSALDPFASLVVTYLIGAAVSAGIYFALNRGGNIVAEFGKMNWSPLLLGVVIVGLEVGTIFAYKAGWQVSMESIVQSAFLTVLLLLAGWLIYHEPMTKNKVVGALMCLAGLVVINYK